MGSKKKPTSMEDLTKGYTKFIKGKEINPNGKVLFDKIVKKAALIKKKQPGLK